MREEEDGDVVIEEEGDSKIVHHVKKNLSMKLIQIPIIDFTISRTRALSIRSLAKNSLLINSKFICLKKTKQIRKALRKKSRNYSSFLTSIRLPIIEVTL